MASTSRGVDTRLLPPAAPSSLAAASANSVSPESRRSAQVLAVVATGGDSGSGGLIGGVVDSAEYVAPLFSPEEGRKIGSRCVANEEFSGGGVGSGGSASGGADAGDGSVDVDAGDGGGGSSSDGNRGDGVVSTGVKNGFRRRRASGDVDVDGAGVGGIGLSFFHGERVREEGAGNKKVDHVGKDKDSSKEAGARRLEGDGDCGRQLPQGGASPQQQQSEEGVERAGEDTAGVESPPDEGRGAYCSCSCSCSPASTFAAAAAC